MHCRDVICTFVFVFLFVAHFTGFAWSEREHLLSRNTVNQSGNYYVCFYISDLGIPSNQSGKLLCLLLHDLSSWKNMVYIFVQHGVEFVSLHLSGIRDIFLFSGFCGFWSLEKFMLHLEGWLCSTFSLKQINFVEPWSRRTGRFVGPMRLYLWNWGCQRAYRVVWSISACFFICLRDPSTKYNISDPY
jgi:hypothetical protein